MASGAATWGGMIAGAAIREPGLVADGAADAGVIVAVVGMNAG